MERLYGTEVPNYVDLYTLIGDYDSQFNGVPAINIENGVEIDTFPLKKKENINKNELHLLALACMSYWHGYDRVIEGLREYYSEPHSLIVFLHMVGNAGDDSLGKWKQLVEKYKLSKYVLFEGFKTGEALNQTFDNCDIALGSLGLYRKNLETASSIKIAEYCARGIPFVYAGNNRLLKDNLPFCMKVQNDDSVININKILDFSYRVKQYPNLQIIMREYAQKNMTWKNQFKKVIDYFGED